MEEKINAIYIIRYDKIEVKHFQATLLSVRAYMWTFACVYTHVYTCGYVCLCLCICICMYTHDYVFTKNREYIKHLTLSSEKHHLSLLTTTLINTYL